MERSQALNIAAGVGIGVALTLAAQSLVGKSTTDSTEKSQKSQGKQKKAELVEDIRNGLEECIGNTPLVRIKSLSAATGCDILGKCEFLEPGGSIKDRVAVNMIKTAEEKGLLKPFSGDAVYEGTVGSTGVSLAIICRAKGYLAHICMPNDQSQEKSQLLKKLGAIVDPVIPAPIVDPNHFVNRARSLASRHTADESKPGRGLFADQFETESNWKAHYETTGPEIWNQTGGKLDVFVAGAGTGGTLSGTSKYLKEQNRKMKIVLADPQGSGLYNKVKHGVMFDIKEKEGTRRRQQVDTIVEGIGINRLTRNFDAGRRLIDDAVRVTDEEALAMARFLVEKEGLFLGSSSAVNCVAAVRTALLLGPGHRIVTILCDSGSRHLSKFWANMDVGDSWDMTLDDVLNANQIDKPELTERKVDFTHSEFGP